MAGLWLGECIGSCRGSRVSQFRSLKIEKIGMSKDKTDTAPLNQTPCPGCGKHVDDRAPACPRCGEKIYVEHPGGITPTRHPPLPTDRFRKWSDGVSDRQSTFLVGDQSCGTFKRDVDSKPASKQSQTGSLRHW